MLLARDVELHVTGCERCILAKAKTAKTTMGSLITRKPPEVLAT